MKYNKPEAVKVANAIYAIQGEVKNIHQTDSENGSPLQTAGAYESDE